MAPSNSKANYKTYEAQARMVRAIVAAHPDVKWNYKEIAACYGSDMTEHALNHRFRHLRAQAAIVRLARAEGRDLKNMLKYDDSGLPATQEAIDKSNIAKYFGQSTADGIQFQFRTIKKDADTLRKVAADGGDVANCLSNGIGSAATTPSKSGTPSRGVGSRSGTARKRTRTVVSNLKRSSSDEEGDEIIDDDENWSEHDATPSKRPKAKGAGVVGQKNAPPRQAAQRANVTIADAAAQEQDSEPHASVDTPRPVPTPSSTAAVVAPSIFGGPVDVKPKVAARTIPSGLYAKGNASELPTGFRATGADAYMSSPDPRDSFAEKFYPKPMGPGADADDDVGLGDGEI